MSTLKNLISLLLYSSTFLHAVQATNKTRLTFSSWSGEDLASPFTRPGRGSDDCFNCQLPKFTCGQFGECNKYDGQCKCPPGWGGIDCLTPQCDSLADGERRRLRNPEESCECKDGWEGINCNVCKTDAACANFPLQQMPGSSAPVSSFSGSSFDDNESELNMTCYRNGPTVIENHQMCDVTNRKILDMLPDRPPQVTFSCNKESDTCQFQFWIGQIESFYCALDTCDITLQPGYDKNVTKYTCQNIKCNCVPGRMLCGESGSIDIGDFLTEEIKGPATFSCTTGDGCKFEEPAMNQLINDVFGDSYITLECGGGECLHYSQVPGYTAPKPPPTRKLWIALSGAAAGVIFIVTSAGLWYIGRTGSDNMGQIKLPEDEAAKLMTDHVPASLHFTNISYTLGSQLILDNISGCVKPGQVMAIMGASGAGKSTFLDILARKNKKGAVSGTTLVNGRVVKDDIFKKVVGYVDQEDTLMSTLTVYETVLYSALLRLPREMSLEAKKYRTLETLQELGILGIKDSRIGDSGHRSISGGEKRRVSIACELVTSPSILFLDEPTSGLDAYNAFNVVDCLVNLARQYNRTVIFTIHQPRSNIVSMFDQLLLLAQGKLIYSGPMAECHTYFENIGHPCPAGFNIADYLIDATMQVAPEESVNDDTLAADAPSSADPYTDEERSVGVPLGPLAHHPTRSVSASNGQSEAGHSSSSEVGERTSSSLAEAASMSGNYIKKKTSQLLEVVTGPTKSDQPLSPRVAALVDAYASSELAASIQAETEEVARNATPGNQTPTANDPRLPDVAVESTLLRGRQRASWATQFRILSGRAFKNLYRDPSLLTAHYVASVLLGLIAGFFFRNVKNDMAGIQNRLGLFFFTLALFGFSCLSSLGLFHKERLLYMRERSNGYYSSFTYFASKILFDILPLRVIPPMVYGSIIYPLVGLVPAVATFWKFILILVMFNLTTASVVLMVSVAFEDSGVASLVGTLIMLYNLLFTGLLINRSTLGKGVEWLLTVSFFHAAYEALSANELRYLTLKETRYGVEIEIPAATVLSLFGLRAQAFWWPDVALLGIMFGGFTALCYILLHFYVREQR